MKNMVLFHLLMLVVFSTANVMMSDSAGTVVLGSLRVEKVCDGCPTQSAFECGETVTNLCSEDCGVSGTALNYWQCLAGQDTTACGEKVVDECGNQCPGTYGVDCDVGFGCTRFAGGGVCTQISAVSCASVSYSGPVLFEDSKPRYCLNSGAPADAGPGWMLARRLPASATAWFPVDDNCKGSSSYGTYVANATADSSFSMQFSTLDYTEVMFAYGDFSLWLIMERSVLESASGASIAVPIVASSNNAIAHSAVMHFRTIAEDPWISDVDHAVATQVMLYGENSHLSHLTGPQGHLGLNVFVR